MAGTRIPGRERREPQGRVGSEREAEILFGYAFHHRTSGFPAVLRRIAERESGRRGRGRHHQHGRHRRFNQGRAERELRRLRHVLAGGHPRCRGRNHRYRHQPANFRTVYSFPAGTIAEVFGHRRRNLLLRVDTFLHLFRQIRGQSRSVYSQFLQRISAEDAPNRHHEGATRRRKAASHAANQRDGNCPHFGYLYPNKTLQPTVQSLRP